MSIKVKESLTALRAQRDNLSKQIQKQAKTTFDSAVADVFTANPKLKSFSWNQYTPYFNDGDECTFSANTEYPGIQYGDEEEREEFYFSDTEWDSTAKKSVPKVNTEYDTEKNVAYEAIQEFLGQFEEGDLRFMFGDHVEVVVTPEGVDTEHYDHD